MKEYREDERFGYFLKEHRIKYAITLEQLSEGLCSASELARIEVGTRAAGKALQNRLLQRLGISFSSRRITYRGKSGSSCCT
ncbi:hypothetical protein [Acetatifactor muris]|uniref:hypothetical protein n=1 Tax=Acetatifactor muris TaxID=879566 RepID=UPI0023F16C20|nr:hypothetical protein [Acetatifactor muris]